MPKTVAEVIAKADSLKDGSKFTNAEKTGWLNEVEGMVQTKLLGRVPGGDDYVIYDYETDSTARVIIDVPDDNIYWLYIMAQVDFGNEEYKKYANTMQMFNAAWDEYAKWHQRKYGHLCKDAGVVM